MKTLTTMTAIAALVAGLSIASAQNPATKSDTTPPASINSGSDSPGAQTSGSESKGTAMKGGAKSKPNALAKDTKKITPGNINAGTNTDGAMKSGTQGGGTTGSK